MLGKWKVRTLLGLKGSEDLSEEIKGIKELQGALCAREED